MIKHIRRAYYAWYTRMITAEIRDTLRDQKEAEMCGEVTAVLDLENYLQSLQAKRKILRAKLDHVSQPT